LCVVTSQLVFTEDELLADDDFAEPLFAGTVRCHGGFDDEGHYVSPRTKLRRPAIEAWGASHCELFSTTLLDVPIERWDRTFPSVEQARFLLLAGLTEPLVATLTRIGTVEGYGANIRRLQPGNLQGRFVEDLRGTAIDHLGRGLFEAHGRDEAGFGEEAGHRDMWFAARDLAFDRPVDDLDIDAMLARMGFGPDRGSVLPARRLPEDVPADLEMMVSLMIRVLFIELSAFHTFAWAETWLSDDDLVGGDGEAARLVTYIRADETPHVDYLRTALTELRDRTWIGESGRTYPGAELLSKLWEPLLDYSLTTGRDESRRAALGEVEFWCSQRRDGDAILEGFLALGAA
jgi:hypothetical protein